eukprot:Sro477_g150750.1 n/a (470) ;mRNA; r:24886-26607
MLLGVEKLLQQACHQEASKLRLVLHVSSVAAMDHLRTQHFVSEAEDYPPIIEYKAAYDKFKRHCEECITSIVHKANEGRTTTNISVCNIRLSAIFSDEKSCIQCSAMDLQARVGCYMDLAIDCNSSVNVSRAMYAVMERVSSNNQEGTTKQIQPVYYYTRPLSLEQPVPYGYYLQEFRRAHQMEYTSIWIPVWVVAWITALIHWFASICNRWKVRLPYVDAMDYLMQVASREHSFDCSMFGDDFPNFQEQEETILECFIRRKEILAKESQKGYYQQSTPPASIAKFTLRDLACIDPSSSDWANLERHPWYGWDFDLVKHMSREELLKQIERSITNLIEVSVQDFSGYSLGHDARNNWPRSNSDQAWDNWVMSSREKGKEADEEKEEEEVEEYVTSCFREWKAFVQDELYQLDPSCKRPFLWAKQKPFFFRAVNGNIANMTLTCVTSSALDLIQMIIADFAFGAAVKPFL